MPRDIVDLSARSRVFRDQPLVSHAWVATPSEVLAYLQHPRSELKKMGIHLDAACQIETHLQNHDWLSGRSNSLSNDGSISVFARGEGDGRRFYRVSLYATKAGRTAPERITLHSPNEEYRAERPASKFARARREASRRSMLGSPLHPVVHKWLSPIGIELKANKSAEEAHRIFAEMVGVARRLIAEKPALREALENIAKSLQRSFNPAYMTVFHDYRPKHMAFHQAFVSVMYARAIWYLRTYGEHKHAILKELTDQLADPADTLRNVASVLESMHPDFVVHAVTEATARRRNDEFIADRMSQALRLFGEFNVRKDERSNRFTAPGRGLKLFDPANHEDWWFLPGIVSFTMSFMAGAPLPQRAQI